MSRSIVNQFDISYTRGTETGGASYSHHVHPLENKAATILYQFRTDHGHHTGYNQGNPPGLKIDNHELMIHMADNLRRDGFITHDPAPGHSVNAADPMESLRLPPLHSALPLASLPPLQRTLPAPPVKQPDYPSPSFQPLPLLQHVVHHEDHYPEHPQQQQQQKQQQDVVMDGDETEEEPETTPRPTKTTLCKFNGQECCENTDPKDKENPRKVVSHIFGRNKICTVFIPDECWVWWCRKHYQRCRYHTDNWALKQIDILYENLDKIESWGGVESFTLSLRKRENDRNVHLSADKVPASRRRAAGRLSSSSAPKSKGKTNSNTNTATGTAAAASGGDNGEAPAVKVSASGRPIRSPVNIASPVPRFLQEHVGQKKSFNEVREILQEIRLYVRHEFFQNNKEVAFPDVEILPNYTQAVLREKGVPGGQLSENNHSRRRRARKPVSSARGRAHPYASNANF
ncbi:hypothetical protein PISL3812_05176 [Talaromyces islandicus]|uniref:Uncharacterized protein n=1 Tax=Talaromyces islandicus TaxID=28573 RepID=A0A0U1LXQ3_TALIS|nr:hypothetical protein PISL3812_05176 [Talaromyces islandicus]